LFPYSAQPYSAAPASGIFAVLDVMMLLLIVLTVLAPAARAGLCRYI
jgi:biopolymer transport protein ExbD